LHINLVELGASVRRISKQKVFGPSFTSPPPRLMRKSMISSAVAGVTEVPRMTEAFSHPRSDRLSKQPLTRPTATARFQQSNNPLLTANGISWFSGRPIARNAMAKGPGGKSPIAPKAKKFRYDSILLHVSRAIALENRPGQKPRFHKRFFVFRPTTKRFSRHCVPQGESVRINQRIRIFCSPRLKQESAEFFVLLFFYPPASPSRLLP